MNPGHGNTTTLAAGRDCLVNAIRGNQALVAFQDQLLYQPTAVEAKKKNHEKESLPLTFPRLDKYLPGNTSRLFVLNAASMQPVTPSKCGRQVENARTSVPPRYSCETRND